MVKWSNFLDGQSMPIGIESCEVSPVFGTFMDVIAEIVLDVSSLGLNGINFKDLSKNQKKGHLTRN